MTYPLDPLDEDTEHGVDMRGRVDDETWCVAAFTGLFLAFILIMVSAPWW